MKKNIITYNDALLICKKYNNFNFSEKHYKIKGYKISTFDYFICDYKDFEQPLGPNNIIDAFEMRGITFVFNEDNSLYKRFLMLPKFFNINQIENTLYNNIKNKHIKNISVKEDGSLIAFMNLPNKEIFAKTIGGFNNEMSVNSLKLLNNDINLLKYVNCLLDKNYTPLFEYVSFDNRIVLLYNKMELKFIGIRNNITGEFVSSSLIDSVPTNIKHYIIKQEKFTLDQLIEKSKYEKDKEGWVVQFNDNQIIKIKTDWYFDLHKLRTDSIFREDFIIQKYLERKLDDIISQIDKTESNNDIFIFIDDVINAINNFLKNIDKHMVYLYDLYTNKYNSDWHEYAKMCNKEKFFGLSVSYINDISLFNQKKVDYIINMTKKLNKARNFVNKWKKI